MVHALVVVQLTVSKHSTEELYNWNKIWQTVGLSWLLTARRQFRL